ncbi:hypothetical protein ACFE04_003873 [Oxalis oulophora]
MTRNDFDFQRHVIMRLQLLESEEGSEEEEELALSPSKLLPELLVLEYQHDEINSRSDNKRLSLSSTTPSKRPQTPKDENERSYQEMGPNTQSPKIKSMKKHYMSPTISAASKVTLPKRKILGEHNQTFDNHLLKTPNVRASKESLSSKTSSGYDDSEDTEQNYALVSDSAQKPYDPVTNYLSPRPEFLRYRPNRCREILRFSEDEKIEGSVISCVTKSCSFESEKVVVEENVSVAAQKAPIGEDALVGSFIDSSTAEKDSFSGDKEASNGEGKALEVSGCGLETSIGSSIDCSIIEQSDKEASNGEGKALEVSGCGLETSIGSSIDCSIIEQSDKEASIGEGKALEVSGCGLETSIGSSIDCSIVEQIDLAETQKTLIDVPIVGLINQSQGFNVGAQEDSSGFLTDSSAKQEDTQFDEEEDEFEEIEKLRGWSLTGLLKFLLVLAALVFSTSYLSNMNSSSPVFSSQAIRTFEDQYFFVKHGVNQLATSLEEVRQLLSGAVGPVYNGIGEQEDNADVLSPTVNPEIGESEDLQILDSEDKGAKEKESDNFNGFVEIEELQILESNENGEQEDNADVLSPSVNPDFRESEDLQILDSEYYGAEEKDADYLRGLGEIEDLHILESNENGEIDHVCDEEIVESELVLDVVAEENLETSEESQIVPIITDGVGHNTVLNEINMERTEEIISVETDQADDYSSENEILTMPNEFVNSADLDRVDDGMYGTENTATDYVNLDSVFPEPTPSTKYGTVLALGVLLFAPLLFGLHFMMKKKQVQKGSSKSVLLNDEEKEKTGKSTYSFAKSRSIINSLQKEENQTESYESYTGDDVSSSMRSWSMKKNGMVESEVSGQSVSYSQPAGDCSYGSFTTEERIFRKVTVILSPVLIYLTLNIFNF